MGENYFLRGADLGKQDEACFGVKMCDNSWSHKRKFSILVLQSVQDRQSCMKYSYDNSQRARKVFELCKKQSDKIFRSLRTARQQINYEFDSARPCLCPAPSDFGRYWRKQLIIIFFQESKMFDEFRGEMLSIVRTFRYLFESQVAARLPTPTLTWTAMPAASLTGRPTGQTRGTPPVRRGNARVRLKVTEMFVGS